LQEKAMAALEQIEKMKYADELVNEEIKEVIELAIIFYRKKIYIEYRLRQLIHPEDK
jgi:hypothetical protein